MKRFKDFLTEIYKRRRYVFHGSPEFTHDSIKQSGLQPPQSPYSSKRLFFHENPKSAKHYMQGFGQGYMYKVRKSALPKNDPEHEYDHERGHYIFSKGVEPKHIWYRRGTSKIWSRLKK